MIHKQHKELCEFYLQNMQHYLYCLHSSKLAYHYTFKKGLFSHEEIGVFTFKQEQPQEFFKKYVKMPLARHKKFQTLKIMVQSLCNTPTQKITNLHGQKFCKIYKMKRNTMIILKVSIL